MSFSGDYVRPLGPDGALVIVSNWDDNSSKSYDDTMLLLAGDKFSMIGDVFAFGERSCRERMTQDALIRVVPDHGPFARMLAEVKRSIQKLAPDCEAKQGKPVKKIFRGDWRWDPKEGGYQANKQQLDSLASENQKRF